MKQTLTLLLVIFSCFLALSCAPDAPSQYDKQDFNTYEHDGLKLKHPKYWILAYDESPSLFADRGVSFNTSEFSGASIFIYKDATMNLNKLADYYERSLNLNSLEHIKEYQRRPIKLDTLEGIKLSWKNTLFEINTVEVNIFNIRPTPEPAFVVFHLLDEDIAKETANFLPFVNSISLK
jgi:hypothetical protein